MIRFVALLACFLLAKAGFTAPKQDAETVLQFWNALYIDPIRSSIREAVDQFNESHPTIHVEVLDVPQINQKLLTSIVGRVPPDVAIFDRFRIASFAERGVFEPFDPHLVEAGIRKEDFFATTWEECVYNDRLYGIPYQTDVRVLYYNKDLFQEAGLDPERPPESWDELVAYSKQLTKRNDRGELTQVGFVPYNGFGNTWLYLYGWQKGARYLDEDGNATLDDPRLLEALRWVRNFVEYYGQEDLRAFRTAAGAKELDHFLAGNMAMIGEEVFMLSRIKAYAPDLNFGMAPLPWPEDGQRATWSGGFAFILPNGASHVKESMEFIAYMTGEEAQFEFGSSAGQLPANRLAASRPFYTDDPNWRVFVEEMQYSFFRPSTPAAGEMWTEMSRAWEAGGAGILEPQEALRRAQRTVQTTIDDINQKYRYPPVPWGIVTMIGLLLGAALIFWRYRVSQRALRKEPLLRREAAAGYAFATPVLIGLLAFWAAPIFLAAIYSLCRYDVLTPARFAGTENYIRLITADPIFWKSLWNTIFYTVLAVPTSVLGSLGLAVLLNQNLAGRSLWRTLFYLPSIVPLVALSLLFLWLFNDTYGLFNRILRTIGLSPVPWMSSADWAKPSLVLMNMWTVGAGMVIFLAGLQGVPRALQESAMIDGAGPWRRFLNVSIPFLLPTIFFMTVINTINAFQVFTQAFLMTNGTGDPLDSTLFYIFYLFRQGFENFRMGYASAMAWIMFLIISAVTALQFYGMRRLGYEDTGG